MIDKKAITTAAARQKKPPKAKALDALKATLDSGTLKGNEHHLAVLYAFFMPPGANTKAAAQDNFSWVALAAAKGDVRDCLNYVYVDGDYIIATDGHRAHRVPNLDNVPPGFYHPSGEKAGGPDWQRFPDMEQVFSSEQDHPRRSFTSENLPVVEVNAKRNIYAYNHDATESESGRFLDKRYVDAALTGSSAPVSAVLPDDASRAVRFRYGLRDAVVMPIDPKRV